jgi:hypothetical protein
MYDFSAPHIVDQVTAEVSGGSATRKVAAPGAGSERIARRPAKADDRPEQDVIDGLALVRNLDFRHAFAPIKARTGCSIWPTTSRSRWPIIASGCRAATAELEPTDVELPFGPGQDPSHCGNSIGNGTPLSRAPTQPGSFALIF